jgi:hypothetical protein
MDFAGGVGRRQNSGLKHAHIELSPDALQPDVVQREKKRAPLVITKSAASCTLLGSARNERKFPMPISRSSYSSIECACIVDN